MPFCGPKCSLCWLLISAWGMVQLGLMGLFYYIHAVALAEDLPGLKDVGPEDEEEFYKKVDEGYEANAINCWIAALMYSGTLLLSAHQFWANHRASRV